MCISHVYMNYHMTSYQSHSLCSPHYPLITAETVVENMSSPAMFILTTLFFSTLAVHDVSGSRSKDAAELMISKYSSSGHLSAREFSTLYRSVSIRSSSGEHAADHTVDHSQDDPQLDSWCRLLLTNSSCTKQCNESDIFNKYAVKSQLNSSSLLEALPVLYISQDANRCRRKELGELMHGHRQKASKEEVWGYGIGFVVLVCLLSNLGGLLAPLSKHRFFRRLLMFLVSTAVGTLAATGLLVLIPEALDLMSMEEVGDDYIPKMSTVLGGIVFFYLSERLIQTGFTSKKNKKAKKEMAKTLLKLEDEELVVLKSDMTDLSNAVLHVEAKSGEPVEGENNNALVKGEGDEVEGKEGEVRTVAWMMLFGDGLHKFVDGLSVGAAYSKSIRTGLTLSIAILCEEFPHELGDIAILLHSGMPMKKALLYNTLSAAVGLAGLAAGIFLGEVHSATLWIFAVTAGIFLYVPLVDMLPEMSQAADEAVKEGGSAFAVTLTQILGLILGYVIILVVSTYAGDITI